MKAVKYCGGCNPGYDRREAHIRLEKNLQETLVVAERGVPYEVLYVINGCTSACADLSGYISNMIVLITELPDLEREEEEAEAGFEAGFGEYANEYA